MSMRENHFHYCDYYFNFGYEADLSGDDVFLEALKLISSEAEKDRTAIRHLHLQIASPADLYTLAPRNVV